jgi:hypothetical protein
MWWDLEPWSLMVRRTHLSKGKVLYSTWEGSHYTCLFFVENLERHRRMYSLSTHGVRQSNFQHRYWIVPLMFDKFGGLPSCITTFRFILISIERLRVVNNILHAFGMWSSSSSSSSSSRSYMIFIHNFMKVSIEPSSFVMTPLFLDTKFSWLLKSYKCCLSQHVKNAINKPTCITLFCVALPKFQPHLSELVYMHTS